MLVQLQIQNIVLIEKLDLNFVKGLSVLTGETGAGKSILLDSLSLALGARGDGGLCRAGSENGQVIAVFNLSSDHPAFDLLQAEKIIDINSLQPINGNIELILRRNQSADGRTRAWINDTSVSANLLRKIGVLLVEIHGQHDDRALIDIEFHRDLLDAFGGLENQCENLANSWREMQATKRQLAKLQAEVSEAGREIDFLRSSVEELEILAPEVGEETELANRRQTMMHAEKIAEDLRDAEETLSGNKSCIPVLASLARQLERKTETAPGLLEPIIERISAGLDQLYDAQNELNAAINASEFEPRELESAEERLFALRAASRKYNVAVENLPELAVSMADKVSAMDLGEEKLQVLVTKYGKLEARFFELAENLSVQRANTIEQLKSRVGAELPGLKLQQAEFIVLQETDKSYAGAGGIDKIEFHIRTNPGTKSGPIFKVASGGELSRILLALKVALVEKGSAPTLIFDEIDTGVGGAVADAIGRRLERLAQNVQVLAVTHAPQVAARAMQHLLISKNSDDGSAVKTSVRQIDGNDRRDEIARMLSGANLTDAARAAADSLLD